MNIDYLYSCGSGIETQQQMLACQSYLQITFIPAVAGLRHIFYCLLFFTIAITFIPAVAGLRLISPLSPLVYRCHDYLYSCGSGIETYSLFVSIIIFLLITFIPAVAGLRHDFLF